MTHISNISANGQKLSGEYLHAEAFYFKAGSIFPEGIKTALCALHELVGGMSK